jgi:hypothetical protein
MGKRFLECYTKQLSTKTQYKLGLFAIVWIFKDATNIKQDNDKALLVSERVSVRLPAKPAYGLSFNMVQ